VRLRNYANPMPHTKLPPPLHLLCSSKRQRHQQRSAVPWQQRDERPQPVFVASCDVDQHVSCQQRAEAAELHLQGSSSMWKRSKETVGGSLLQSRACTTE
jgi:hypothetical protein